MDFGGSARTRTLGFFGGVFLAFFPPTKRVLEGQGSYHMSGISKPMVCVRFALHENDGNHETDENDEHNSDSDRQGCAERDVIL